MKTILFLCTGNSCRSQMAEGWGNFLFQEEFSFYSAGISKHGLNPRAAQVMKEMGVDISGHESNTLDELSNIDFDFVFTVCSHAHENCPVFSGKAKIIHIGFDDPPALTKNFSDEEETLSVYRRVRDEVKEFVLQIKNYL